jgi:hypothetical protein
MKFSHLVFLAASLNVAASYVVLPQQQQRANRLITRPFGLQHVPSSALSMSSFESDFASAMPEAPKMSLKEYMLQSADRCVSSVRGCLGEGVEPVPELAALEKVRDNDDASTEELAMAIYELMIERGMTVSPAM